MFGRSYHRGSPLLQALTPTSSLHLRRPCNVGAILPLMPRAPRISATGHPASAAAGTKPFSGDLAASISGHKRITPSVAKGSSTSFPQSVHSCMLASSAWRRNHVRYLRLIWRRRLLLRQPPFSTVRDGGCCPSASRRSERVPRHTIPSKIQ